MNLSSNIEPLKKRDKPSKENAMLALELIKTLEKETDEEKVKEEAQKIEDEKLKALAEKEKIRVQLAQEKVKRVLRENIRKKTAQEKVQKTKNYLEQGKTIKWKSINLGQKLEGYFENKLIFEIKKGMTVFNLYIKDKTILSKKTKSYQGCSTDIQKLKERSEKLLKLS